MSDIILNGITYPSSRKVAFPGTDGHEVVFDLPEDADTTINADSERPPMTKAVHAALQELRTQIAVPFKVKGTVAAVSALPASGNQVNDAYYVTGESCYYCWNGSAWGQGSPKESAFLSVLNLTLQGKTQNITSSTGESICSNNLDAVANNTIYGLVPYDGLTGCPPVPRRTSTYAGLLVTMAKEKSANSATKTQIFFCRSGTIYLRQYWSSAYESWKTVPSSTEVSATISAALAGAFAPSGQNITNDTAEDICSGDANNLPNNNIFGLSVSADNLANMPLDPSGASAESYNGALITFGKETARGYGDVQIYLSNRKTAYVRTYTGGSWNRWTILLTPSVYRLLGVGDSICEGWRNNGMGFVGGIGAQYNNLGVTGATLGTASGHTQIASELESLSATNYSAVIADGGINDYYFNVPLGTVPNAPKTTAAEIAQMDKTTVCGGLEYLCWLMITKLPHAQRFFLITHKTNDYPTRRNSAGYTQQEMHDAIVAVCNVYNVEVIDVYRDSLINTRFDVYKSPTAYSSDNTEITHQYYVDKDGIHPLWLGYDEGYYPMIRRALLSATYKYAI